MTFFQYRHVIYHWKAFLSVYHSKVKLKYIKQGFPFENFGGGDKIPPPTWASQWGGGNIRRYLVGWESTILPIWWLTSKSVDPLTPLTLIYDSVTLPIMCKCMYRKSSRNITCNTALNGQGNLLFKADYRQEISQCSTALNNLKMSKLTR